MNVLHKIMFLLKGTIYNNPNDKRLFVYRNERHKWFGITINFGHPMAGWFWLFNAVLLLGFILLINVLDDSRVHCIILTSVFLFLLSSEAIRAFWIAEFGCVNGKSNVGVYGYDNDKTYHNRSYVFLIINFVIVMMPLLFAVVFYIQRVSYLVFVSCLAMGTLGQMVMIVYRFLKTTKEQ